MTGPDFHETRTGHRFLNHTMPRLVEELERLNGLLERLVEQGETRGDKSVSPGPPGDVREHSE